MVLPPGPRLPASAQTLAYALRPLDYITRCHERYGDIFTIDTLLFGVEVNVVHPDAIRQIFTGDPDTLHAGEANAALEPLVGARSVLLLDGAEHLRHRRLLMPPFHGERMLSYARTMRTITEEAIARFPVGRPFALHPHMQRITLDIILRTVFGVDDDAHLVPLREALPRVLDHLGTATGALALAPVFRRRFLGLTPWEAFVRDVRFADDLIHRQIVRRRAEAARGGDPRPDILGMLLEARDEQGEPLSDVELRDELMTLLVAGHETTATMLCWAFDLILGDASVHDRILAEIGKGEQRNEYVDATLKEVLRLRPVIPAVGRVLKAPMEIGGVVLPAGVLVVPSTYLTHRLPAYYPEPDALKPERFFGKKVDPYAWLPFGGGVRRCLGMAFALFELELVLTTILSRVRMRKARPEPARVALRGFTFVPANGTEVVVESSN